LIRNSAFFRDLIGFLAMALISSSLAGPARAADKPTLWLIGDSTVQVGTPGQQGWGTQVPQFFDTSKIDIENRAKGGRSSRTFLIEGLWEEVRKQLKPGDYVMIQFGHNDTGPIGGEFAPGRPARASIPGNTDESQEVEMPGGHKEVVHTYGWYLRKYATEAKEKGATPIIVSPIPKRGFINGNARRNQGGYAAVAQEAANQLGIPFLNLDARIADKYNAMGEEASVRFFHDNVHTTPEGAEFNARVVAEGIRELERTDLSRYLSGGGLSGEAAGDWDSFFEKKAAK
jgi:rhamnogalacturonan acetylesterase